MTVSLRIALAQFDFPVGAVGKNAERIVAMIAEARDEYGADVVMFPELALSGYPPEDLLLRPSFLRDCAEAIERIAAGTTGIVAVVGWPQAAGSVVYNAASVLRDGKIEQTYRKRELPNYAVFDERRYFDVDPDREDCVFDLKGVPVGLLICEDLWFAEPIASTVRNGAQLVLGAERLAVRARQARAARCPAGPARARNRRRDCVSQRGGRSGCAGVRRRVGRRRWRWPRASSRSRIHRSVARRRLRRRDAKILARAMDGRWRRESRRAGVARGRPRHSRLLPQERLPEHMARFIRRRRFLDGAGAGGRCVGRGQCHRGEHCPRVTPRICRTILPKNNAERSA